MGVEFLKNKSDDFKRNLLFLINNDSDVRMAIKSLVSVKRESYKEFTELKNDVLEKNDEEMQKLKILALQRQRENSDLKEEFKKLEAKYYEKEKEINFLKNQENDLRKQIDTYKEEIVSLKTALSTLEGNHRSELLEAEQIANKYKNSYETLDEVYNKYLSLGSDVHRQLQRVLNPGEDAVDSADLFLGFGIQEGNIVALWETVATNAGMYIRIGKLEDLVCIFEYFLGSYKKITYKQIEISKPYVGENYDERFHTRTANSNATGKIVKVILPGFVIGKNINKKALVCVE